MVNNAREKKSFHKVNKSAVYRYLQGVTHRRGVTEARGRKKILARRDVLKLDQARKRLLKAADSRRRHASQQMPCEPEGFDFVRPGKRYY